MPMTEAEILTRLHTLVEETREGVARLAAIIDRMPTNAPQGPQPQR